MWETAPKSSVPSAFPADVRATRRGKSGRVSSGVSCRCTYGAGNRVECPRFDLAKPKDRLKRSRLSFFFAGLFFELSLPETTNGGISGKIGKEE